MAPIFIRRCNELIEVVFHKGEQRDIDSYSAFFDNGHRRQTGLDAGCARAALPVW